MSRRNRIGASSSMGFADDADISANDRDKEKRGEAKLLEAVGVIRDIGATHTCGLRELAFRNTPCPQR
ncbi:hypothetical protein [Lichenifustis flavocetrariae]|uniref:Uncharacterized protein n=1 Tax=Lichenifustis flavocetrariae TaxID=2949735 RepID=A0AA41YY53_9HYPH|nr:hypothetical protein [Lichenifustis flavocetrariae]MCW6509193.1 hypothetical protein [Lichenifustis flavocetrariae]